MYCVPFTTSLIRTSTSIEQADFFAPISLTAMSIRSVTTSTHFLFIFSLVVSGTQFTFCKDSRMTSTQKIHHTIQVIRGTFGTAIVQKAFNMVLPLKVNNMLVNISVAFKFFMTWSFHLKEHAQWNRHSNNILKEPCMFTTLFESSTIKQLFLCVIYNVSIVHFINSSAYAHTIVSGGSFIFSYITVTYYE